MMPAPRPPLGYHPAYAIVDCEGEARKRPSSITLTCAGCQDTATAGATTSGTVAAFAHRWWTALCPRCRAILAAAIRHQDPDQLAAALEILEAMELEAGEVRP